jgi:TIR domain
VPLSTALTSLPRPLGFVEGYPRRVVLLAFGLASTDAGEPLLNGFGTILRLALERFQGSDPEPTVTETDVRNVLDGDEPKVRALTEMLSREAPFLRGVSRDVDEEWSAYVTDDVVRYWDAFDIWGYLRIRASELFRADLPGWSPSPADLGQPASHAEPTEPENSDIRDAFISHAGEDKETVARPLAQRLEGLGHTVWLDEQELVVGDSLSESIDRGLAASRFGVVVLSKSFFGKSWPQRELAGLVARETIHGERVILPIWHGIDAADVAKFSPPLAERYAASTRDGLDSVAQKISDTIRKRGVGPARPGCICGARRTRYVAVAHAAADPVGRGDPTGLARPLERL